MIGFVARTLITMGNQRETGGTVSLLGYSQVPFGLVAQMAIFGQMPTAAEVIAMAVIIGAGTWTIVSRLMLESVAETQLSKPAAGRIEETAPDAHNGTR